MHLAGRVADREYRVATCAPHAGTQGTRGEPRAVALRAAKAAVDPHGVLNPGVLIEP